MSGGYVELYNVNTGHTEKLTLGDSSRVESVRFSPDGRTLASADDGGQVIFYSLSGRQKMTINEGFSIYGIAFSPNGQFLAATGANDEVTLRDLTNGNAVSFASPVALGSVAFSPNGRYLASGDTTGTVTLRSSFLWTSSFQQLKAHLCNELGNLNLSRTEWSRMFLISPIDEHVHEVLEHAKIPAARHEWRGLGGFKSDLATSAVQAQVLFRLSRRILRIRFLISFLTSRSGS